MMRWLGILIAVILIASCFMPWITIESKQITITGFDTTGTNFGKPGLVHVVVASLYILLLVLNKTWSKRAAFFICAVNVAWAIRNFMIISACYAGDCPTKRIALYMLIIASIGCMGVFLINDNKRNNLQT